MKITQPGDPIPELFAHRGDPRTSWNAARRMTRKVQAHREEVLRLVADHPGATARELAAFGTLDYYQISRRVGELVEAGLIHREGERGGCSCLFPGAAP